MIVAPGLVVRTSYGTGPYVVLRVDGPCCCSSYLDSISGRERPSKPHFHITCRKPDGRGGNYHLNGYSLEGKSVWSRDRLTVESQLEMFS